MRTKQKRSRAILAPAGGRAGRATVRHRAAIPAGSACRPRRHARIPGRKNKPSRKSKPGRTNQEEQTRKNKPGRTNQTKETKPREKPREKEQPVHPDKHTLKRRELSGFSNHFPVEKVSFFLPSLRVRISPQTPGAFHTPDLTVRFPGIPPSDAGSFRCNFFRHLPYPHNRPLERYERASLRMCHPQVTPAAGNGVPP